MVSMEGQALAIALEATLAQNLSGLRALLTEVGAVLLASGRDSEDAPAATSVRTLRPW